MCPLVQEYLATDPTVTPVTSTTLFGELDRGLQVVCTGIEEEKKKEKDRGKERGK